MHRHNIELPARMNIDGSDPLKIAAIEDEICRLRRRGFTVRQIHVEFVEIFSFDVFLVK